VVKTLQEGKTVPGDDTPEKSEPRRFRGRRRTVMAMKKRRETAEERRLRKQLAAALVGWRRENGLYLSEREAGRLAREADAKEAAELLLEEKKRREEDIKTWNERLIAKDGWIVDLQKQHDSRVEELAAERRERECLAVVVLQMAKWIYAGDWSKG
jgi:hypothetical protein